MCRYERYGCYDLTNNKVFESYRKEVVEGDIRDKEGGWKGRLSYSLPV